MANEAPVLAPLTDAEHAWLHDRVTALGGDAARVHAAPLAAGPDGRIVLSTDAAASAVAPVPVRPGDGADEGAAVLGVHAIRVGRGESLVVRCPHGRPVRVVAGTLQVEAGGQVVLETHAELHASRAAFAAGAPIVVVGADGRNGGNGADGDPGRGGGSGGGNAHPGKPGEPGKPGPGGDFVFNYLAGTLTIVAGGGSGGDGGNGGNGGNATTDRRTGFPGGEGGNGGAGGSTGDGGTIVVSFETMDPGASIHPVMRVPRPGIGGRGGRAGHSAGVWPPGKDGADGGPGEQGWPPVFAIRTHG
jgi:hypothetical protein